MALLFPYASPTIFPNTDTKNMESTMYHHGMYPLNYCMSPKSPPSPKSEDDSPVLDLCVRNKSKSPQRESTTPTTILVDNPQTSTDCFPSPSGSYHGSETSSESNYSSYPLGSPKDENGNSAERSGKAKIPRPFKAYPKDLLTYGIPSSKVFMKDDEIRKYTSFRNQMLAHVQNQNKGTNARMRRNTQSQNPGSNQDPTYWEKRRKNNEAAKRSRDARRAKEDEIAIRCAFLEQENYRLTYELASAHNESKRLRKLIYKEE